MAQIIKLPPTKPGYRRVRKRCQPAENPDQLSLFPAPTAQILTFQPGSTPFEQALLSDERGDPATAADLYQKAIDEQDCVADAFCNLGIIETQNGNTIKALDCFTTALKNNPRHSEAHYNLGNLYFDLNDFKLAQIHFEMAAQIEPTFANAWFNLALVHAINNDAPAAQNVVVKYKQLVPPEDARAAEELLQTLKRSLTSAHRSPA